MAPAGSSLNFDANVAVSEIGALLSFGLASSVRPLSWPETRPCPELRTITYRYSRCPQSFCAAGNIAAQRQLHHRCRGRPASVTAERMRLAALGGDLAGKLRVQDFKQLTLDARLHNFVIPRVLHELTNKQIGYDGTLSGPIQVRGDLKAKGTSGFSAEAHLEITPGTHGVPVSSRLNASYNGARDTVSIAKSFVALPHSRLRCRGYAGPANRPSP